MVTVGRLNLPPPGRAEKSSLSYSNCLNQNRKSTGVVSMSSMKLLKMADGGAIEKKYHSQQL